MNTEAPRILVIGQASLAKGLQWAFDQITSGTRALVYSAKLSDLAQVDIPSSSAFVCFLELGQPVPVESLKRLGADKPGVCAFLKPTPQQLLDLQSVEGWRALAWDGASFQEIAEAVLERLHLRERQISLANFVSSLETWILENSKKVFSIITSVEGQVGVSPQEHLLDPRAYKVRVGAAQSRAEVIVLKPGADVWGEFVWTGDFWSFHSYSKETPSLKRVFPGTLIQLPGVNIAARESPDLQYVRRLLEKFQLLSAPTSVGEPVEEQNFESVPALLRAFMLKGASGELVISANSRVATVYLSDGAIAHVVSGAVYGVKALERIFAWNFPKWRFYVDKLPDPNFSNLNFGIDDFLKLHRSWQSVWATVSPFLPPLGMVLAADSKVIDQKSQWTHEEFRTLAAVVEYRIVRDILNACPLLDTEIIGAMIQLRKQGFLKPDRRNE